MTRQFTPAAFLQRVQEAVAAYQERHRSSFRSGAQLLRSAIDAQLDLFLESTLSREDASLLKKHLVAVNPRPEYMKSVSQASRKIAFTAVDQPAIRDRLEEALTNHAPDEAELDHLISELVPDFGGMEVSLPYRYLVVEFSSHLLTYFEDFSQFELIRWEDYITNPQPTGYRAIHFNLKHTSLPYELQIKSYFQASWSRFTHDLVYKHADALVPSELVERAFVNLASLLTVCDSIAEDIFQSYLEERYDRRRPIGAR